MRNRKKWLVLLGVGVLTLPIPSVGQTAKIWRVGFLSSRSRPTSVETDYFGGFRTGMRDLGYVEGKNLVIEWRFAEGKYERFPDLLADLIALPVDVIVTDGSISTQAAQKATRTIPIVFASSGDPVGSGVVKSLAHPGGNTTGISILLNDVSVKQVEILRSIVPGLSRIGVILNPQNPYSSLGLKGLRAAADIMKVQLLPLDVRNKEELETAFAVMMKERVGAFLFIADAAFLQLSDQMVQLELKYHVPGMGWPRQGGLFYYGQNTVGIFQSAAAYVDKILKGANPADLPVEQPTKLELVINRKTAKALGLTIPAELLLLADKVIE